MYKIAAFAGLVGLATAAGSYSNTTSSAAPSSTGAISSGAPACWSACFAEYSIGCEEELCGNTDVDKCIATTCTAEDDKNYWTWYDSFCGGTASTSSLGSTTTTIYPTSTDPVSAAATSAATYGWSTSTVYTTTVDTITSCAASVTDCPAHSTVVVTRTTELFTTICPVTATETGSSTITTPQPTATSNPSCWNACFAEFNVTSESALCGNTNVDKCIFDTCSSAEDQAYWAWYDSFCAATSSSTSSTPTDGITTSTTASTTSTPITTTITLSSTTITSTSPATPTSSGNCWDACFAEYDITSESELCGNANVSKCIYTTCSSALDQAYWQWYDSFCTGPSSSVVTTTYTTTGPASSATTVSTTLVSIITNPSVPKTASVVTSYYTSAVKHTSTKVTKGTTVVVTKSSVATLPTVITTGIASPTTTGLPAPPPYVPAGGSPYGPGGNSTWATGTGAVGSSPTYLPVPATGAGVVNKPAGVVLAVAMAFVALF